jgi:large subunit ribosomal protein L24e
MPRCSFCSTEVAKGKGTMYVYASGKIDNFCSSKCQKNLLKLGRKPLKIRWTEAYRKEHKKTSTSAEESKATSKEKKGERAKDAK